MEKNIDQVLAGWGDRDVYPIQESETEHLVSSKLAVVLSKVDNKDGTTTTTVDYKGKTLVSTAKTASP